MGLFWLYLNLRKIPHNSHKMSYIARSIDKDEKSWLKWNLKTKNEYDKEMSQSQDAGQPHGTLRKRYKQRQPQHIVKQSAISSELREHYYYHATSNLAISMKHLKA